MGSRNTYGTLPTQIGLLSRLTSLNLYYNSFSGSLPTEIGQLSRLVLFDLRRNAFTSALPTELSRLISVAWFYVVRMCHPAERTEVPRPYCRTRGPARYYPPPRCRRPAPPPPCGSAPFRLRGSALCPASERGASYFHKVLAIASARFLTQRENRDLRALIMLFYSSLLAQSDNAGLCGPKVPVGAAGASYDTSGAHVEPHSFLACCLNSGECCVGRKPFFVVLWCALHVPGALLQTRNMDAEALR